MEKEEFNKRQKRKIERYCAFYSRCNPGIRLPIDSVKDVIRGMIADHEDNLPSLLIHHYINGRFTIVDAIGSFSKKAFKGYAK